MGVIQEIYLAKKDIKAHEWLDLIKTISQINGHLKRWHLIVQLEQNTWHFYVETKGMLPSQVGVNFFLKKIQKNFSQTHLRSMPNIYDFKTNILDLHNIYKYHQHKIIERIDIIVKPLSFEKRMVKTFIYFIKKEKIFKKRVYLAQVSNLFDINFNLWPNYFFKTTPKYLNIQKAIPFLAHIKPDALMQVDSFPYMQDNYYLTLENYTFFRHSIIFGTSGSGKSKFIASLIKNLMLTENLVKNYKVIVIDPHAALENDIGGLGRVLDFQTEENSINLFKNQKDNIIITVELLLDIFKDMLKNQYNAKLERLLRYSLYLLIEAESFTFQSLMQLLTNIDYRHTLINQKADLISKRTVDFFLTDFNELKSKSYNEAFAPLISFIDEILVLPPFQTSANLVSLQTEVTNNTLTLFSLNQTTLGLRATQIISGLIMQQLLILAQSQEIKEPIILIIDEVAIIENPILKRFLAEARKYNVSLILAGQYFSQLSLELQKAIFANVCNYYIFRVAKDDAQILVDNFNMDIPLNNTKEQKVKTLTDLNNRECIVRIMKDDKLIPAFKGQTLEFISVPLIKEATKVVDMPNKRNKLQSDISFTINDEIDLHQLLVKTSASRKVIK